MNNINITIEDAMNQLGEVGVNTCTENKIMMKVFNRIYIIYSVVYKKAFEKKLLEDVVNDEKIKNKVKQLLIKFVVLSGYNYDDSVYKMIKTIHGLSNKDLINYYIYIIQKIHD